MSTPAAAGMIAPSVGMTDPTSAILSLFLIWRLPVIGP
jgi:hypothetical protein